MAKILYADDEIKYRRLVELFLKNQGHQIYTASNGEELIELFSVHPDVDLIILDIMMPVMNGIETCEEIRTFSTVPVLMLTALGDLKNEIEGLEVGADDYIAKPFSNEKLIARVSALLRRQKIEEVKSLHVDGMTFNEENNEVTIKQKICILTQKEFALLKVLVTNKDHVVLRDTLLDKVWGFGYDGDPRTLDTHIKSLRAKIGQSGEYIKTSRGKGYFYRSEQ